MNDSILPTDGQIVPDVLQGWRYNRPCKSCGVPVFTANCWLVCPFKKYKEGEK